MIQFSREDIIILRQRVESNPGIIHKLIQLSDSVIKYGVKIPSAGIATWELYYYCPVHSVELLFNYNDNKNHFCPICNKAYTGEPYDGAWWRAVNRINADSCFYLALLWLLTEDLSYLNLSKEILMTYAKYYPDYEVHGGIPYNNPGKANAQTLCEAVWIQSLAYGYDIIKEQLTYEETEQIEKNLFLECANFLVENRMDQLHNHEVIVGSSIGILGMILDNSKLCDFAVNSPYGLIYQLEHGVLGDGFWFEGTFHYHYYALEAFLNYEKFARYTTQSLIQRKEYRKMLKIPLKFLQSDYCLPRIGDGVGEKLLESFPKFYEFAYKVYGDTEFAWILNKVYEKWDRNNLDAFLYGNEILPKNIHYEMKNYHDNGNSGMTLLRAKGDKYLLFRHGSYGGEHDHYDKLGIHFLAFGEPVFTDLGTVGYGAKMHYDYFKNTATHNTVSINEENQPPSNGRIIRYEEKDGQILVEAESEWKHEFSGIDSLTNVEWNDQAYQGITMRRLIIWCDDYFIEAFLILNLNGRQADWILHGGGILITDHVNMEYCEAISHKKPLKYLFDSYSFIPTGVVETEWKYTQCEVKVFSYCSVDSQMILSRGPGNPVTNAVTYLLHRVNNADKVLYVNVFETYQGNRGNISSVEVTMDEQEFISVQLISESGIKEHKFRIGE